MISRNYKADLTRMIRVSPGATRGFPGVQTMFHVKQSRKTQQMRGFLPQCASIVGNGKQNDIFLGDSSDMISV